MAIEVTDFLFDKDEGCMIIFTDDRDLFTSRQRQALLEMLLRIQPGQSILMLLHDMPLTQGPMTEEMLRLGPTVRGRCLPYSIAIIVKEVVVGYRYYTALKFDDGRELLGTLLVSAVSKIEALRKLQSAWPNKTS